MNEEIVIFRTDDESINVEVRFEDETAWLTQDQMSVLFSKSKSTINEHIKNVFKEGELDEKEVVRKFRITTPHGAIEGKTQSHEVNFYNLDVIISVGYRVKSLRGTQFRQWATKRLKEYKDDRKKDFEKNLSRVKTLLTNCLVAGISQANSPQIQLLHFLQQFKMKIPNLPTHQKRLP